ncbi:MULTISPECIES: ATP-binding protein [Streptomyces]|uniref:ATP-binding protein n=2 Tax=Streptomyces TaxID=1883 RepID=A0ABP9IRX7_9ACTN|nr:ATP-binding protein [Streptomyces sp. 142MFCol3.1]
MEIEPSRDKNRSGAEIETLTMTFAGRLQNVTDARLAAEGFLRDLARASPPSAAEHWDDVLLVVTELAANTIQYAPGPFELHMRPTITRDGVHVTLRDGSSTPPTPRRFRPSEGGGGIGWHLVHALCDQVSVVTRPDGKDVHAFLPW